MTLQWNDRSPQRPDRYLDWDLMHRLAAGEAAVGWCSVLVQLKKATGADPAADLQLLRDALAGPPSPAARTVAATTDEVNLLDRRIAELRSPAPPQFGVDDPALAFFVYMPETVAYASGQFADKPHYKIRLVGPPVPGLRFEQLPHPTAAMAMMQMAAPPPPQVAVGIIDNAIAFANERFRTRTGCAAGDVDRSRIKHLWIQALEEPDSKPAPRVLFGRQLDRSDIETALKTSAVASGVVNEDAVYAGTGAVDFTKDHAQATYHRGGHGTTVMDLACGFSPSDRAGDNRPILAVQLPEPAQLRTSGVTTASYVLQGLRQILHWADASQAAPLPLVVNFSYGYYAGPKDGAHVLEREMKRLIESRRAPTALVLPAGNTYRGRVTAQMKLSPGTHDSVDWMILPDCGSSSFLEIWLDDAATAAPVRLELSVPGSGVLTTTMPASGKARVLEDGGKPVAAIYFDAQTSAAGRSRIFVAINPTKTREKGMTPAPSGAFGIKLDNTCGREIVAHLYIQRQDTPAGKNPPGRQSYFEHRDAFRWDTETASYDKLAASCPITHSDTLTAIASMPEAVVVGAAMAAKDGKPSEPSLYTSSGPTHSRPGPDFAAVADDDHAIPGVIAAGTRSGSYVITYGTSVAAPQLARRLADAGARLSRLKTALGVAPGAVRDPRLGWAVVPKSPRSDIPPRRRP